MWETKFHIHTKEQATFIVPYILSLTFLGRWECKTFSTEVYQAFIEFNLLLGFSSMQFWFVSVIPTFQNTFFF